MRKIAIYIPTLDLGGAEKQAMLLASMLSKDNEVHLITLDMVHRDSERNSAILKTVPITRHLISYNMFKSVKQLTYILKENHIEILFNYLTFPNILGSYAGRKAGVLKIYNGIRNAELPIWKMVLERYVHNHWCTKTIFNCHSGADNLIKKGFCVNKCIVIPNCFGDIAPVKLRDEKQVKNIIIVGRFVAQKDYFTAIRAISKLKTLRRDFIFHIVGYGEQESTIRNWVKKYDIVTHTIFHIKPSNIPDLLKNADIYLSTSLFEGTSNSIMEALNYSLPVVCTDVGDNSYLVNDKINGYLHPVGAYDTMASSLNDLLSNLQLRNDLGARGNQILRENFSTERFYKRYKEII